MAPEIRLARSRHGRATRPERAGGGRGVYVVAAFHLVGRGEPGSGTKLYSLAGNETLALQCGEAPASRMASGLVAG